MSRPPLSRRATTTESTGTRDPSYEVDWEDGDPKDPRNWSTWYKGLIIFSISFGTLVVVLYSTSYTSGIHALQEEFNVSSEAVVTLGLTTYLLGIAVGCLILAPISEAYGRKPVYAVAIFIFALLVIPCAKATSLVEIIVFRFFGAVAGSCLIANAPGTVGDIVTDEYRALAFSIWSIGPLNGPVIGPIIGGFVTQYLGWRWANWVVLILGAVATALMWIVEETYSPKLLQQKAKRRREESGEGRYWSRYDQQLRFVELMKVNLRRPFVMALTEPICIFWNAYIAIIYGLLYLCFVAYPIVFQGVRGWSLGFSGLAFVGIGVGSMVTICSEPLIRHLINSHTPEAGTGKPPPEAAMFIVCVAAVLCPIGELWFAWTCAPASIHWAIPISAGIPFGAGNTAVFIYASNYLVHSYGIYAASAMAGNSLVRSFLGGTLPLAGPAMYRRLGPNWAGTLLAIIEIIIIPIPFVFYRYGATIRTKSTLIRTMREDQDKAQRKRAKHRDEGGRLDEKDREAEAEAKLGGAGRTEKEYQV